MEFTPASHQWHSSEFSISDSFNIFMCTFTKFMVDTKLGESVDLLEGIKALQRDVGSPDKRAKSDSLIFNVTQYWIWHLGHSNLISLGKRG